MEFDGSAFASNRLFASLFFDKMKLKHLFYTEEFGFGAFWKRLKCLC